MNLTRSDLWTPLFALDRLNSWLRAGRDTTERFEFWNPLRSVAKPIIYWVKTHAILASSRQWQCEFRRVIVRKKCRSCWGTGKWTRYDDWDRSEWEPCWHCDKGVKSLHFVESTIGPIRWHTPSERWYMSSLDVYLPFRTYWDIAPKDRSQHYEVITDWEPDQPGRPMPLEDAFRDLRIILNAWPHDFCFSAEFHHRIGWKYHAPHKWVAELWLAKQYESAVQRRDLERQIAA